MSIVTLAMSRPRLPRRIASFSALLLAAGLCGAPGCAAPAEQQAKPAGCVASCEASGGAGQEVCGTDKKTYSACAWDCGNAPAGVSTFPGACQADGSPAADAPPVPADGDLICDFIRVGTTWQAVECADDLGTALPDDGQYLDGKDGEAFITEASFGGAGLHILGGTAPAEVDHRARYGAVKAQGSVSSCTAFAMTAGLEGAVASSIGQKVALSDMHLWSRYYKPEVEACVSSLERGGIVTAAEAAANGLPYDEATALAWEQGKSKPDPQLVAKLDGLGKFEIARLDNIAAPPAKPTAAQIQKAVAEGLDVWTAMFTSDAWGSPTDGVIADYEVSGKGGHAILVVGYKTINGAPYFIFRNSWGPWADGGYGYISFKTMEANVLVAAAVTIKRKDGAVPTCADGQSADLSGACRKVCDDKSLADAAGNCGAVPVECAAGQTADASGTCVSACKAGDTTGQGFKASCSERACTWTIDAGGPGCPAGDRACTQTCPAPTCAVITSKNELGQTIFTCAAPNQ